MANINLEDLIVDMRGAFGAGAINPTFDDDFISAVNRTIFRINRDANLIVPVPRIFSPDDDVELDEKYEDVFSDGVIYNLDKLGRRVDGDRRRVPTPIQMNQTFSNGIRSIYRDLKNTKQKTATNDIIGLGASTS